MRRFLLAALGFGLFSVPLFAFAEVAKDFVPLTGFSGLEELGNSEDLSKFFNSLYKICIGLAATIAVFQIIRAGIMYMGGDSFTEKKEAKSLIMTSLIGLLLVLSPVIVFSIINREILELRLNLGGIQTKVDQTVVLNDLGQEAKCENNAGGCTIAPPPTAPGCTYITPNSQIIDDNDNMQRTCCASQSNGYATCQVQRRNSEDASGNVTSVAYCGCTIKPNIGLEFYEHYYAEVYRGPGDLRKVGYLPAGTEATLTSLEEGCKAAGGEYKVESTRLFFQTKVTDCPVDAGAPATKEKEAHRCAPMKATCTAK